MPNDLPPPAAVPEVPRDAGWRAGEALAPEWLYRPADFGAAAFATSDDLEDLQTFVGQDRAVEAVRFAIGMRRGGFNLFALGPPGTGKFTVVRDLLDAAARGQPTPFDWCYVNNFDESQRPRRLALPPGRGAPLRDAMKTLVAELSHAIPAAFERDDYRAQREAIDQQVKQRTDGSFGELQEQARAKDIALVRTPTGLALAPMHNGEVIEPDAFRRLPDADRKRLEGEIQELQGELEAIVHRIPEWERQHRDVVRKLNRDTTAVVVNHFLAEARAHFADLPEVVGYLDSVERDILDHADDFLTQTRPDGDGAQVAAPVLAASEDGRLRRFQINLIVDNSGLGGAPVVYEDNPSHQNLVGRIEHLARLGALVTDFNLIRPGALHRANGGYLILDAQRLLAGNLGWESLKRALRAREIRTLSPEQLLSLGTPLSLEPEPIPLEVKVVLLGPPALYYLLSGADPDFGELFKVAADFDDRTERTPESTVLYARLIAKMARRQKLKPIDRSGIARTIEEAARIAGDNQKLSTEVQGLADLLEEANHFAEVAGTETIGVAEVEAAIGARAHRAGRARERLREAVQRDEIHIATQGSVVGQMNGLTVMALGGYSFGSPSRITARVRFGRGEVIDIEREVALGGPIHSKGVLILSGFLGGRFGKTLPLSLTASLVFEQSYGGVEGDSASAAELCTLLSAIGEVPLRQCFAMTGSVDQLGNIQAIGGVNEKIEGFFEVCRARGLSGDEGVLIPVSNVAHLMLRRDVVEAVAAGRFRIIPVATIDQALEWLTGLPAGVAEITGAYPDGTVNQRVAGRLAAFARRAERQGRTLPRRGNGRRGEGRDGDD